MANYNYIEEFDLEGLAEHITYFERDDYRIDLDKIGKGKFDIDIFDKEDPYELKVHAIPKNHWNFIFFAIFNNDGDVSYYTSNPITLDFSANEKIIAKFHPEFDLTVNRGNQNEVNKYLLKEYYSNESNQYEEVYFPGEYLKLKVENIQPGYVFNRWAKPGKSETADVLSPYEEETQVRVFRTTSHNYVADISKGRFNWIILNLPDNMIASEYMSDEKYKVNDAVEARFERIRYFFDVNIIGQGDYNIRGQPEGIEDNEPYYLYGRELLIDASPQENWKFNKWRWINPDPPENLAIDEDNPEIIEGYIEDDYDNHEFRYELDLIFAPTLNIDLEKANETDFEPSAKINLNPEPKEGYEDNKVYDINTEVDIEIIPDEGWTFLQWSNEVKNTNKKDTSIIMDDTYDINAYLKRNEYNIQFVIIGEGQIEVLPDKETFQHGEEVRIKAIPDEGYCFQKYEGAIESENNEEEFVIEENKKIYVLFSPQLHINIFGEGEVEVEPEKDCYSYEIFRK